MKVLIVGNGKGSWQMRGVQIGAAIGARVTSYPTRDDWAWADVAVLVKRAALTFAPLAHAAGVPVVWDAIDFWRQPADHSLGRVGAVDLLERTIRAIRPALTIGATRAMADACGGAYLPHHSWDGLVPTPARERVQVVAYEGNPVYLELWTNRIAKACERRGWTFVLNPPDLRAADLIVSFRHGVWDGFLSREWKSGVKVVNAIAAARPFLGQDSAARRELNPPGSRVEQDFPDLDAAFDTWESFEARSAVVTICEGLAPQYRLEAVAADYQALLARVAEARCAA